MEWRPARTKTTGAAPAHLDTAPLAAHAGQHVGGAARLPADLAARAGGQVALPPMVVVRTLRRGSSATRRDLGPAPPPFRRPGPVHLRGPGARPGGTGGSRCRRRAHSRGERAAHTLWDR